MEEHAQRHLSDPDLTKSGDVFSRIFEGVSKLCLELLMQVLFRKERFCLFLICVDDISRERCKEFIALSCQKVVLQALDGFDDNFR